MAWLVTRGWAGRLRRGSSRGLGSGWTDWGQVVVRRLVAWEWAVMDWADSIVVRDSSGSRLRTAWVDAAWVVARDWRGWGRYGSACRVGLARVDVDWLVALVWCGWFG